MIRGPPQKDDCTLYRASKGWGLYRVCKAKRKLKKIIGGTGK